MLESLLGVYCNWLLFISESTVVHSRNGQGGNGRPIKCISKQHLINHQRSDFRLFATINARFSKCQNMFRRSTRSTAFKKRLTRNRPFPNSFFSFSSFIEWTSANMRTYVGTYIVINISEIGNRQTYVQMRSTRSMLIVKSENCGLLGRHF